MNRGIKCLAFVLIGLALVCTTAGSAAAQTSQGIMFAVKEGSGLPGSILEGKTYYFRMLEFNHQPTVYGQRSSINYGYIEFKTGGIFDASIWWSSSDCLSGGPISDTGTYNVNPDWSMTFTGEGGTGPTFLGTISSDGSFVTLSRCENVGGETVQLIIVAVERDPTQTFVLGDISGSYQLSLLSMEEFQTSTSSASAVNAELTSDGIGGWTASYTAISSSGVSESGSTSGTYTVDTDGRFEFFEGAEKIFEGYISKEKDKLIISQVICTAADDIEQGIAVAHKIESGRTYGLADLTGNYPFRMLQLHDIESASNRDSEIIVGTANFDGAGNWTTSDITACENEGNTETIPVPDLPYGTYTVDPAGKVILTPTHAGASPGEMWLGSYSADTESVVFTSATVLGAFSITAGVMNVHRPDGTLWTYVDVVIGSDFTGSLPGDIDAITVVGPSGPLSLSMADFTYYPQWREFFAILPGSPVTGQYDFTVTSGASFATAVDFQNVNITLPIPENASRVPSDGAIVPTPTPEICWAEVNPPGPPWHYRLEINDMTGNRVYASDRMLGMLCHTPPPGLLVPGESYQWRIRVLDADNWVAVQNRSHSDWIGFTVLENTFSIVGSVMHMHRPDGTLWTYLSVEIGSDFTGTLPDDIDQVSIQGPSGPMALTKDDFTFNPQWGEFFIGIPGSPELGQYTFTVLSGALMGTAVDNQNVNLTIPLPDTAIFSPPDNAVVFTTTPIFSWGAVAPPVGAPPGMVLHYRLEINNLSDERVYASSRVANMLSHTVPAGLLEFGQDYLWRVRVTDADSWVAVQNRSNNAWLTVTTSGATLAVSVPSSATEGDGTLAGEGSVSLTEPLPIDLTVALSSSDTSEVTVPSQVVIAAGETSALFDVTIVDDALFDGTQSVTIAATSAGLGTATASIDVVDEDDTDSDLMDDDWERLHFGDLSQEGDGDYDLDQLSNRLEYDLGTLPNDKDTDNDIMEDGWEALYGLNPNDESDWDDDLDSDGIINRDEFTGGSNPANQRPDQPGLASPANGATDQVLSGLQMTTDPYSDPEVDAHTLTEWQISAVMGDFTESALAYQSETDLALTDLVVPSTILLGGGTYYWRVRFSDAENNPSLWSEEWSFTMEASSDGDGDGIPDPMELPPGDLTDLNENGIPDEGELHDRWKCFNAAVGGGQIGVEVPAGCVITAVEGIAPATIADMVNRPDELPWGLIGFSVTVPNPGDTIDITATLSGSPPANPEWYVWTAVGGWESVPATITTSAGGNTQVVFTKTDGGAGDADGLVNGVIVDPVGLGAMAAQQPAPAPGGGGGGGCFVTTAAE